MRKFCFSATRYYCWFYWVFGGFFDENFGILDILRIFVCYVSFSEQTENKILYNYGEFKY